MPAEAEAGEPVRPVPEEVEGAVRMEDMTGEMEDPAAKAEREVKADQEEVAELPEVLLPATLLQRLAPHPVQVQTEAMAAMAAKAKRAVKAAKGHLAHRG